MKTILVVIAGLLATLVFLQLEEHGYIEGLMYSACDRLTMHQGPYVDARIRDSLAVECAGEMKRSERNTP